MTRKVVNINGTPHQGGAEDNSNYYKLLDKHGIPRMSQGEKDVENAYLDNIAEIVLDDSLEDAVMNFILDEYDDDLPFPFGLY